VVSSTPRPHFTRAKEPVPILQEAGWAPGPVWTGGKSRLRRDSIAHLLARSQSLYRMSYRAHSVCVCVCACVYKKVKVSRYRPSVAHRVGRGTALLFHDHGTRRGEWSAARPGRNLPPGKTRYRLYRGLGGPQGRSGRAENLVPTGIRSRTFQPVVSRCTY